MGAEQHRMAGDSGRMMEALEAQLSRIAQLEPQVGAWAWWDADQVRAQARLLADQPLAQTALQPLRGLTVGIKDIIDTADMPTENGTVLHAGRRPAEDAAVVRRLRQCGAIVMGKTVTTELATYSPGKTRNPHRLTHTPGGSSSGSAAAVACGMVDAALGSQTNGSTIRPAAFCGVVSFKPGRDRIDRRGMLVQSPTFDTVGLFARDVQTVARLYEALCSSESVASPTLADPQSGDQAPRAAWWATPWWSRIDAVHQTRLRGAAATLGALDHPATPALDAWIAAEEIVQVHGLIMEAEIARSFEAEYERGRESLSASLQGQITRGRATTDASWGEARLHLMELRRVFDAAWPNDLDVIALPSATGTAPEGLSHTGDPIMCTVATALDLPAINLPGLQGADGLPLGLQLLGRRGHEGQLLRAARHWEMAWKH